jgi:polyisoprenoid-binding protein YceI
VALSAAGLLLGAALLGTALAPTEPRADDLLGRIDPALSRAEFSLRVIWVRRIEGHFEYIQGAISHPLPGRFNVKVQIAAQSLSMKNPEHAEWAQSAEFFDAERYPWIAFEAHHAPIELLRDGGELRGLLSLRGVTLPASFELLPTGCLRPGLDCAVEARGELQRSEFGMTARRWAVSDKVRLALRFRLRQEPAPGAG